MKSIKTNKLKIAMIGHKRIPSREGGVEIVVEELATRMVKHGHEVHVYNRGNKKSLNSKFYKLIGHHKFFKGVRIINIPTINLRSLDALLYSFFATIRSLFGGYDAIHYHAEGPCVMLIIPHILGIRTVATIHGLDWQRAKWGGFATWYLKLGEKIAAKYADKIIVLSENVQTYFLDTYSRDTLYIPNGVNTPEILNADVIKKKYGLKKNDYFLFLARIVPEKGLHYLLEAYRKIRTDKKLVIAGGSSHSDDYLDKIKKMADEDKRIIMTGFVEGQELQELFSNCLTYILPSDIEGMPISLLEAMSYERKCLVSNIKENIEVVGDKGFSFNKSDIDSLEKSLINILSNKNESDPGACKDYDLSRFDWNEVAVKNLNTYFK